MATPTPQPTSSTAKELTSLSLILHLTHHRNKNQHRLAKWYKSLSTLRRQVQKLLTEVQDLDISQTFSTTQKGKESKYVREAREKVETRVRFWEERMIERWYLAFSNLTADNQYATLGLMLLGCLARVRRVVRPFGKEIERDGALDEHSGLKASDVSGQHDLGEVIRREDLIPEKMMRPEESANPEIDDVDMKRSKKKKRKSTAADGISGEKVVDSTPSKHPKKKRKKGDAFDDLFSSLI